MSQANYIIICRGRTKALEAPSPLARLLCAADTAANVVDNLSIRFPALTKADVKPISDILHEVMGSLASRVPTAQQAEFFGYHVPAAHPVFTPQEYFQKTCQLFHECDELMEKFEGPE